MLILQGHFESRRAIYFDELRWTGCHGAFFSSALARAFGFVHFGCNLICLLVSRLISLFRFY